MKSTLLVLIFLFSAFYNMSQTCIVSGAIKDTLIKELQLELLYGDAPFDAPSVKIKIAANKRFSQSISLSYPVFTLVRAGKTRQRLLLSPGRNLQLQIDARENRFVFSGKAAVENELVRHSIIDSTPFFMKGEWLEDKKQYDEPVPYTKVTLNNWQVLIMDRIEEEIANATAKIQKAAIPEVLKKILASEMVYAYQQYLIDFATNRLRFAKNPDRDSLLTRAIQWQPLPDSMAVESGMYANAIFGWNFTTAFYKLRKSVSSAGTWKERVAAYLSVPPADIDSLTKKYDGERIIRWLYDSRHLPHAIQDKMLFNNIVFTTNLSSYNTSLYLLGVMKENFPHSNYLPLAEAAVQQFGNAIQRYKDSGSIYTNTGGIHTLNDLVKPYRGKIVYLDIWGTWCGPCKTEMKYVHELKQQFAGNDVVFVYLAKDEDSRDSIWKEYVKREDLGGEHYRMNEETIKTIWSALQLAGRKQVHTYPSYVIFDREGKIAVLEAERPSSREKLYDQLHKML